MIIIIAQTKEARLLTREVGEVRRIMPLMASCARRRSKTRCITLLLEKYPDSRIVILNEHLTLLLVGPVSDVIAARARKFFNLKGLLIPSDVRVPGGWQICCTVAFDHLLKTTNELLLDVFRCISEDQVTLCVGKY